MEYVRMGDNNQAFTSMASDLGKHPETADSLDIVRELGMPMLMGGMLSTEREMTDWIQGFN